MPLVKICGLLSTDMARQVAALPVDYMGFVFAPSKRQVSAAQAAEMIRAAREANSDTRVKAAGVFVNPTVDELASVLEEAPLDVLQLHGQETPAFCKLLAERFPHVEIFKVMSLSSGQAGEDQSQEQAMKPEDPVKQRLEPYRGAIHGLLLDTFDPVYGGGSGKTFAWHEIPPYAAWCKEAGIPLLVAGGLQPDNVHELLGAYFPDGVDVSSGVETNGKKDINKITRFVERVKSVV